MSRRTIEQIRQSVFDEIEHQKMLDRKAETYRHNKAIYDALKRMSRLAGLCALTDDGTLYIYEGTFNSMMDVYKAMGVYMRGDTKNEN